MSVRKYRSVEDMPPPWLEPGSAELFRAMRGVWDLGRRTLAPRFPPGVYKHRSVEELGRLTETWAARNFEAYQARLARAGGPVEPPAAPDPDTSQG